MEETYRSYLIQATAARTPCIDFWVPVALILWREEDEIRCRVLNGSESWCKSADEATFSARAMARNWIDDGKHKDSKGEFATQSEPFGWIGVFDPARSLSKPTVSGAAGELQVVSTGGLAQRRSQAITARSR